MSFNMRKSGEIGLGINILIFFMGIHFGNGTNLASFAGQVSRDVNDLRFFYYPTPNQEIEIDFDGFFLPYQNHFSPAIRFAAPTVLIIDGFLSNRTSPMSTAFKNAYASWGTLNVFVLDWGSLSGAETTLGNPIRTASTYKIVLSNVSRVGRRVAEFLNFLRESNMIDFRDVTLIGESLGAHVAANAAQAVQIISGKKIGRVVGLDPAGPLTQNIKTLDRRDANFVDIYHTNRGLLGTINDGGHVNIYVNGGTTQPGCLQKDFTGLMGFCSHSYSWRFFLAAFNNRVLACPCRSPIACKCPRCENRCGIKGIVVGPNIPTWARGLYYVRAGPLN